MTEITLQEFLVDHTQKEAAMVIGCTQGAVWQMLKNNRDIRFKLDESGNPSGYYEIKKAKRTAA